MIIRQTLIKALFYTESGKLHQSGFGSVGTCAGRKYVQLTSATAMAAAWAAIFVPFLAFRKPTVPCAEQEQGNFINPFQKLQSAMKTYIIKHCTNKTCSRSSKLQSTHTNRCLPFTPKHSSTLSQPRHPHIPVSSHCMLILMKLSEMVYCSIVTL